MVHFEFLKILRNSWCKRNDQTITEQKYAYECNEIFDTLSLFVLYNQMLILSYFLLKFKHKLITFVGVEFGDEISFEKKYTKICFIRIRHQFEMMLITS